MLGCGEHRYTCCQHTKLGKLHATPEGADRGGGGSLWDIKAGNQIFGKSRHIHVERRLTTIMSESLVNEVALLVSRALNMINTNVTLGKRIVTECLNSRSYEDFVQGLNFSNRWFSR